MLTIKLQKVFLPWLTPAIIVLCATGIIVLQQTQIKQSLATTTKTKYVEQEKAEKFDLGILSKIPAVGLDNLWADWFYLRFIQYFGDGDARNHTGYGLSSTYFRQIVDRDPRFVDAMIKLDTATSLFEGNPQSSVAFLGQSLIRITPEMISFGTPAYYLWFYKGVDQLLFLGDPFAAKRSYRMAMNWMEKSPIQTQQKRDLMARTEQTIQFLERNPKSQSAQIGAWASLLGNLVDPRTIARVMTEIRNLGGEIYTAPDGRVMVRVPPNIN
jgi:hypothetical protein